MRRETIDVQEVGARRETLDASQVSSLSSHPLVSCLTSHVHPHLPTRLKEPSHG